jgi:hypothetical protein
MVAKPFFFSKPVSNRFSVFKTGFKPVFSFYQFLPVFSFKFQNRFYKVFNWFKDVLDRIFESFINLPLQTSQKYF